LSTFNVIFQFDYTFKKIAIMDTIRKTSKYTMDNVPGGATVTAAKNVIVSYNKLQFNNFNTFCLLMHIFVFIFRFCDTNKNVIFRTKIQFQILEINRKLNCT